jgi:tetratricopeptide (TPR) repeat protein
MIMLTVCPFPLNISSETAILGRIGTRFNNEDVLNQRFDWQGDEGQDMGYYFIRDGYRIPKTFKEYALNSNIISYADPVVRDLASLLSAREPSVILEKVLPAEEVGQVIKRWQNLPTTRSELKALASSIAWHQETDGMSLFSALRAIKANMSMMNLSSFVDYRSALTKGELDRNPSLLWLRERMEKVRALSEKGDMELAEAELRLIIERKPWYAKAYAHLISLSMDTGKYAQAISYFTQLQLIEPDLYFYMRFFRALRGYLNIGEAFSNEPAIFHVPRYVTMSPVFYLIARVKELAGGRNVRKVVFPTVGPQDLDKLYDVLDRLSPNIIDAAIAEASFNISKALLSGEVLSFFGIPIMLQEKGKTLLFNYAEIDPQAPVAVVKG